MQGKMNVAVMNAKRDVSICQKDIKTPERGEVLIRIEAVGVCGSDMHYYSEGKIGDMLVKTPFVLGHEAAGTIVELGEGVSGLSVGDRVAIEAGVPCGGCEFCLKGEYNICPEMRFLATPPFDGVFSEYAAYDAKWVHKLPKTMSGVEGVLIEPLAVGMHAAEIAGASLGHTAFIYGCGCIGLMTLLALKSRGVSQIYMCDIIRSRLDKAKELGATEVFDVSREDALAKMMELTYNRGVDSVYEMTGAVQALRQTVEMARKGGVIVLVGLGANMEVAFDFGRLIWNEVQIRTCFRYANIYPKAINAIASGQIPVERIVSHTRSMREISEALEYHVQNKNDIIKMIIEM